MSPGKIHGHSSGLPLLLPNVHLLWPLFHRLALSSSLIVILHVANRAPFTSIHPSTFHTSSWVQQCLPSLVASLQLILASVSQVQILNLIIWLTESVFLNHISQVWVPWPANGYLVVDQSTPLQRTTAREVALCALRFTQQELWVELAMINIFV